MKQACEIQGTDNSHILVDCIILRGRGPEDMQLEDIVCILNTHISVMIIIMIMKACNDHYNDNESKSHCNDNDNGNERTP